VWAGWWCRSAIRSRVGLLFKKRGRREAVVLLFSSVGALREARARGREGAWLKATRLSAERRALSATGRPANGSLAHLGQLACNVAMA
jgi:hypothetical protein